ncbi:MAG TPA: GntR family transcriptional regulator [Candidatus Sulfotelmatobacter sp.]|nr:GntR family transcriptional regulator [Candidatus Sulfotelmatobacter sp.]
MSVTELSIPAPKISHSKMGAEVAAYVRDLIMSGHLTPGEHLRLNDLAVKLSVSTTPVREALLVLEKEGFIESEPHRGFRVKLLTSDDISDLFELHAVIAGMLASRAIDKLTDDDISELTAIDRKIRKAVADGAAEEVEEQNFRFHRMINRSADSVTLRRFLTETTRYIPRRYYPQIPGWLKSSAQDHGPILAAIRRKDAAAVQTAVQAHMRRAGNLLVGHLTDLGVWSPRSKEAVSSPVRKAGTNADRTIVRD